MKKYRVVFVAYEVYEVEAETEAEACDLAGDMLDADPFAFDGCVSSEVFDITDEVI